jgi:hypothetical protein
MGGAPCASGGVRGGAGFYGPARRGAVVIGVGVRVVARGGGAPGAGAE